MAGGMNKAVLGLSLVMAVFVVGTIGSAIVQFIAAAEGTNDSGPVDVGVQPIEPAEPTEPEELRADTTVPLATEAVMNASEAKAELHRLADVPVASVLSKPPGRIRLADWGASPTDAATPATAAAAPLTTKHSSIGPAAVGDTGGSPPLPAVSAPAKIRMGQWNVTTPLVRVERNASEEKTR